MAIGRVAAALTMEQILQKINHEKSNPKLDFSDSNMEGLNYNEKEQVLNAISECHYLTHLNFKRIKVEDFSFLKSLTNLTYLNLDHTGFKDLSIIRSLTNLTHLHITANHITDITPLENLTKLSILDLDNNLIEDYSILERLPELTTLYLHNCKITDLKPFSKLFSLKLLWLGSNSIKDISPLSTLINLERLFLHENKIEDISPLSNLSKLEILGLNANCIEDIKPLKDLNKLRIVSLHTNVISDVSLLLPFIKTLPDINDGLVMDDYYTGTGKRSLSLANNPLTSPPIEITNQGNKAILNYFAEKDKQGEVKINEVKMLVVGEGGVGKTSLVQRLTEVASIALPTEEATTKGISIRPYEFKTAANEPFKLNIWDFGGQEIYHSTHQFFLTKRSLYILVDDTRRDDKDQSDANFSYWLQVVEQLSDKSPILIVQNEKADRSKQLDTRALKGRFGNIKEIYQTNLLDCRGVDEVKKAIEFFVQQLPHIGETLPKQWVKIRQELEALAQEKDFITLAEYLKICKENLIIEREKALFLSSYLHDLGIFLHFQGNEALENLFVLRSTWATDAVYKVLDSEKIKQKFGLFNRSDLKGIWDEDRYLGKVGELIALMQEFKLCYELPITEGGMKNWLSPQLLKIEKPDFDWDTEKNLVLSFKYDFMPKGLLSRFIVEMNRYVKDTDLAWRTGVVLTYEKTKAWITETYGRRDIVIRVVGQEPKEMMTLMVAKFDEMHDRYAGLRLNKMIPCNCSECEELETQHFYEFDALKKRKEKNIKPTIECPISGEDVNIQGLIDGIFVQKDNFDKKKVVQLVEKGRLAEALEVIEVYMPKEKSVLMYRFNQNKNDGNLGLNAKADSNVENLRMASAILDFLNEIEKSSLEK